MTKFPSAFTPSAHLQLYIEEQLGKLGLKLNPVASTTMVEEFEQKHGISLPCEYRWFITNCGNGGAGPVSRMPPLQQSLYLFTLDYLGDFYEPAERFPHSTYLRCLGLPDEFPNSEADGVTTDDDFIDIQDMHLPQSAGRLCVGEANYTNLDIFHYVLVLNGPRRGQVWNQRMPSGPVKPSDEHTGYSIGFLQMYLDWLSSMASGSIVSTQNWS